MSNSIALGGPGSGWRAEAGHIPGSQGGKSSKEGKSSKDGRAKKPSPPRTTKQGALHASAHASHAAAAEAHTRAAQLFRQGTSVGRAGALVAHQAALKATSDAAKASKATGAKPYGSEAASAFAKMSKETSPSDLAALARGGKEGRATLKRLNLERADKHELAAAYHRGAAHSHKVASTW